MHLYPILTLHFNILTAVRNTLADFYFCFQTACLTTVIVERRRLSFQSFHVNDGDIFPIHSYYTSSFKVSKTSQQRKFLNAKTVCNVLA